MVGDSAEAFCFALSTQQRGGRVQSGERQVVAGAQPHSSVQLKGAAREPGEDVAGHAEGGGGDGVFVVL